MNPEVVPVAVPPDTLLAAAAAAHGGAYIDCYSTQIMGRVTHADFVEAFYTSWLFKIERRLLGFLASRPATDSDARKLARSECHRFSAWRVEARDVDELLLADITGRTKSWLMVTHGRCNNDPVIEPIAQPALEPATLPVTQLLFGSAVLRLHDAKGKDRGMGAGFHLLLGFHKLYSRRLLGGARARLLRRPDSGA
ncbi:MAG: hypothetical protein ABIN96_14420 [Rubrivivax sp.]